MREGVVLSFHRFISRFEGLRWPRAEATSHWSAGLHPFLTPIFDGTGLETETEHLTDELSVVRRQALFADVPNLNIV
jgi:hypothetical protein